MYHQETTIIITLGNISLQDFPLQIYTQCICFLQIKMQALSYIPSSFSLNSIENSIPSLFNWDVVIISYSY